MQNPLTSLEDDVAAANRIINAQTGPVVLVGHSWGGAVITQAGGNDKVKSLVYVAAFAPTLGAHSAADTTASRRLRASRTSSPTPTVSSPCPPTPSPAISLRT